MHSTPVQTAHRNRRAELGEPAKSQESKVAKLPSGAARGAVDDLVLSESEEYSLDEPSADSADRMSKNEATDWPQKARGNQRQSEAIRGNQLLVIQRPSETIRFNQATPQVQSDAIRRQSDANQTQSGAIR